MNINLAVFRLTRRGLVLLTVAVCSPGRCG